VAPVPDIEALQPRWLTRCLAANGFPDAAVRAVGWSRIGTGQTGACARLELDFAAPCGAPQTLVAKFPSEDPLSRSSAVAMGIYRREVEFYRDVAPRLTMRLPHCYYLDVDEAGERFLILMEDLAPARPGDQVAGCSVAVARAAVLELVGLQAPTWEDEALGRRFAEPEDGFFKDMFGLYNRMLPVFLERFGQRLAAEEREIIEALGARPHAPLFAEVGRPFCLEHRDYRLDNLMIDERGAVPLVTVLDWQGMRTGRPLNDVALCLAGALDPAERRHCEQSVLEAYHRALCAAGVTGFSWEQCWLEYRRAAFAGFGLTVVAAAAVEQTERGDAMFTAMARRYARHALDVGAADLLD
jgi:hypothetical protein